MGSFYFDVSIDGFKKTFGVKDISRNIKMLDSGISATSSKRTPASVTP